MYRICKFVLRLHKQLLAKAQRVRQKYEYHRWGDKEAE